MADIPITKFIPIAQGKYFSLIDEADYEFFSQWKWQITRTGYAVRNARKSETGSGYITWPIWMHKQILGASKKQTVDHINLDKLDNRRSNLRIATFQQNMHNRPKHKDGKNKYKGVWWNKHNKNYNAFITLNRKRQHLGCFVTAEEAAMTYNEKAKELYGEFAYLNLIEEDSEECLS